MIKSIKVVELNGTLIKLSEIQAISDITDDLFIDSLWHFQVLISGQWFKKSSSNKDKSELESIRNNLIELWISQLEGLNEIQ